MNTYYFSGGLQKDMLEFLINMPDFEPLDVLVSQIDRSSINKMLEFQKEGYVRKLFIDSGAFSVHTGKAKLNLEEYISYLNSIDDHIEVCAQVDTIPGKFGQPKSKEDYEESAKKSWENYLYMRTKLKSPKKLTPVFHYGESFDHLKFMLDWVDENGDHIPYIGISPANDVSQHDKNVYMGQVYDVIKHSSNPDVKTHLYGMTSLDALTKYPCYSADSISHRLQAAYNKVYTRKWGTISVSKKPRSVKNKSNMSFVEASDKETLESFYTFLRGLNIDPDTIGESNSARCAVCMHEIQQFLKENPYKEQNLTRTKKLFKI